jgi:hypothetical protein
MLAQFPILAAVLHIPLQLLVVLPLQPLLLAQAMFLGVNDGTLRIS